MIAALLWRHDDGGLMMQALLWRLYDGEDSRPSVVSFHDHVAGTMQAFSQGILAFYSKYSC